MGHLKDINSGYFKHLFYALYFVLLAQLVVITGLIHAFFPFVFKFTPYNLCKKIVEGTEKHFKNYE